MKKLLEQLNDEVILLDGAMGTLLQQKGLTAGYPPDLWNLEHPDIIQAVHEQYIAAGSTIITTNTFGASRLRLQSYHSEEKLSDINIAGIRIAQKAARGKAYIAGDVGPLGKLLAPLGDLSFSDALTIFREQIKILIDGGCDLILIETMIDPVEAKAALIAAQSIDPRIPVMVSITYGTEGITDTGVSAASAAVMLEAAGADILGVNCGIGPELMVSIIQAYRSFSDCFIAVKPNAGIPYAENNKTCFPLSPADMAHYIKPFIENGAHLIGGCCGTTPETIKAYAAARNSLCMRPLKKSVKKIMRLASKTQVISLGEGQPFVQFGERINPTGKSAFAQTLKQGHYDLLIAEAKKQATEGAHGLDVNVGVPLIDEPHTMEKAVRLIQHAIDLPLVIDSASTAALEAGILAFTGKPLINSVNGQPERMEKIFPLVKKYGCAVIALCCDQHIPRTAHERIAIAERILKEAEKYRIAPCNIIFDCVALPLSTTPDSAQEIFATIRLIKKHFGLPTMVGLSNISFGLPHRPVIHSAFLSLALNAGLDAAICNPAEQTLHHTASSIPLILGQPHSLNRYIAASETYQAVLPTTPRNTQTPPASQRDDQSSSEPTGIYNAVLNGEVDSIIPRIEKALEQNSTPMHIFTDIMTPAIMAVGKLFEQRKKFLPHLMAAAETMQKGAHILTQHMQQHGDTTALFKQTKGIIIFATVKNDVHDIGKNMCVLMLRNYGFQVIDLGKDIDTAVIISEVQKQKPAVLGLSALMTTTMIEMQRIIEQLNTATYRPKVMVGGAAVTQAFADQIGADGYGRSVGDIVSLVEKLLT